jgi:hypothetical protein
MDARAGGGGGSGGGYDAGGAGAAPGGGGGGGPIDPMREIIVLAACGANELLPQVGLLRAFGALQLAPFSSG